MVWRMTHAFPGFLETNLGFPWTAKFLFPLQIPTLKRGFWSAERIIPIKSRSALNLPLSLYSDVRKSTFTLELAHFLVAWPFLPANSPNSPGGSPSVLDLYLNGHILKQLRFTISTVGVPWVDWRWDRAVRSINLLQWASVIWQTGKGTSKKHKSQWNPSPRVRFTYPKNSRAGA